MTGGIKEILLSNKKRCLEILDDRKTINVIRYFAECGFTTVRLSGIRPITWGKYYDTYNDACSQYGIRFSRFAGKTIDTPSFIKLCRCASGIDYDELYINAIRTLAHNWFNIAIIDDSKLSKRVYDDLTATGKTVKLLDSWESLDRGSCTLFDMCLYFNLTNKDNMHIKSVNELPLVNFFDFFSESSSDSRSFEKDIVLNLYKEAENKGVSVYVLDNPQLYSIDGKYQTDPASMKDDSLHITELKTFLNDITLENIEDSCQLVLKDGYIDFIDYKSENYNYLNGERPIQIDVGEGTLCDIYLLGTCMMRGHYCSDKTTIGYYLQSFSHNYKVHIKTVPAYWVGMFLHQLRVKEGDIIILQMIDTEFYVNAGIPRINIEKCYYDKKGELRNGVMWDTPLHVNGVISQSIAKTIYEEVKLDDIIPSVNQSNYLYRDQNRFDFCNLYLEHNYNLRNYIDALEEYIVDNKFKCGAVVVNCNPFSLGHLYLIETARAKVDYLYVFVVQEDRSFFRFEDRFNMVKIGTKEMSNVIVLPSGRFMISIDTMPGYFYKDRLQDMVLDASHDLRLFCEVIAPVFHIGVRFAGEEPEDRYTKQYNNQMKEMLPQYGICFEEIPRKESEGRVISASTIRGLFKKSEWDRLGKLVPKDVRDYLKNIKEQYSM